MKRRIVFKYYHTRADIICLQETHFQENQEVVIKNEWGYDIIFSHGLNNTRGVCILFNNKCDFRITKKAKDQEGRMIACEHENIDDPTLRFTLCNMYTPNKDQPKFFINTVQTISEFTAELIMIGDFNLVMDIYKDQKGKNINYNHWKSLNVLQQIQQDMKLEEIWRIRNPDLKAYSWMRSNPDYIATRIDFALVTQGLMNMVNNCTYTAGIKTDHLAFWMNLEMIDMQ